jgi:hypothetical protein
MKVLEDVHRSVPSLGYGKYLEGNESRLSEQADLLVLGCYNGIQIVGNLEVVSLAR